MAKRTTFPPGNRTLSSAKAAKQDEFYTQLADIENELKHYRQHFAGKVVLCNCDDPFESNFFKYFAANFNALGLKRLVCTSYCPSPIMGKQLTLFVMEGTRAYAGRNGKKYAYVAEINEVPDLNKDGSIGLDDVEHLLRHDKNATRPLKGDDNYPPGDFRSAECVEILKGADIVVTNPPFSLFREYIAQLVEHGKQFLIIGSKNAITYKEVFRLIKENQLWVGVGFNAGNAYFKIPKENVRDFASGVYDEKTGLVKFRNVGWFTNMDHSKRHEFITLFKKYSPEAYPTYDNYDAINVNKVADIPEDYDGAMGVPITFLDKYNPDQFEIIGCFEGGTYGEELGARHSEETSSLGRPVLWNGPIIDRKRMYKRLVIRRKHNGRAKK